MPVTNQWRQKAKVEEPQPPPPQTAPAGKKAADAEEPTAGRRGRFSQASKKDEKQTKAAEAAKQQSEDDDDEEDNAEEEEESNQPGRIRNLAGFFATQKDDPKNVKKKRFEVADSEETIILENEPEERLEGVVRCDDPGEWEKPIELEKGWAKNMANIFQNRPLEDNFASKKPFKMDIEEGAQTIVLENEPVVLEGVVRSGDKTEDVIGKRGRIKNIAGRFANPQSGADDEGGYRRDPVDVDPSRSRNVADKWKNQQYEESSSSGGGGAGGGKPKWMLELESAKEYGVFENEPEVRSDVVHADDEQPDVISAQHTRNLRKMWSQIEKDENKEREPRSSRPDIVIRPKKKEPSPEPEPPPPPKPVEEPKPTRRFGAAAAAPGSVRGNVGAFGSVYGRLAKKEKTPPPPEPEPPPPKAVPKRGGFRQAQQQQPVSPPTNPEPESKTPFKTSLKPVPRRK